LLLMRIRYEERVLESAFPEYAAYRVRVGALGPWLG
jgi:protein-S-isoprenylcysteine O-methyltransferase Ste14